VHRGEDSGILGCDAVSSRRFEGLLRFQLERQIVQEEFSDFLTLDASHAAHADLN
jgi:hypothetical protein